MPLLLYPVPQLDIAKVPYSLQEWLRRVRQIISEFLYSYIVSSVSTSTQLTDETKTVVAGTTGLTMTMPAASADRIGRNWTIILGTAGYVNITVSGSDTFILPTADTIIQLNIKGASITLRCVSATSWGII